MNENRIIRLRELKNNHWFKCGNNFGAKKKKNTFPKNDEEFRSVQLAGYMMRLIYGFMKEPLLKNSGGIQ